MPIETRVDGDPSTVYAAADWVRSPLASGITATATQIYVARNQADAGWHGAASENFRELMTQGARAADEFGMSADGMSRKFESVAADLERAQREMQRIRGAASAAGLTLNGTVIEEPGPAPPAPGPVPTGSAATPEAVRAHANAVAAQHTHTAQVQAYRTAQADADDARAAWHGSVKDITNTANSVGKKSWFIVGELALGGAQGAVATHTSKLIKHAEFLDDQARRLISHARAIGATSPAGFYQNLDAADDAARAARQTIDDAAKLDSKAKWSGLKVGSVLAVGGIVYDISQGKAADQAVVSGAAGFGASVAAGATVGTFVGGPFGTAAGAAVGAVAGVFTSGMVDSLWQHGLDSVGQAISDGSQAVADTGEAIGTGVVDAAEWATDGISDAWNAIF